MRPRGPRNQPPDPMARFVLPLLIFAALALPATASAAPDIGAYRGLGTWVSIYSGNTLADPAGWGGARKAGGVRTLYLEPANYRQSVDIVRPRTISAMIEAAHAQGIEVVAWYLPSYARLAVDERRAEAAIDFTTAGGQRFDGFALDIESDVVRSLPLRNRQAKRLARAL